MIKATGSPVVCDASSDEKKDPAPGEKRLIKLQPSELITDGLNSVPTDHDVLYDEVEKMESLLPTMWLGSQSGRQADFTILIIISHTLRNFTILIS